MAEKFHNNQDKELKDIYGHIMDYVQKITAALYRVTDLMSDKEPLKWTLRDTAMRLHDNMMSIRFAKDKERALEDALSDFFRIIKTLELVPIGVYVSNLNFEILKREYVNLRNFIEGKNKKISAGNIVADIGETKFPALSGFSVSSDAIKRKEKREIEVSQKAFGPEDRKDKILEFLKAGGPKTIGDIGAVFEGSVSAKATQRDLLDLVKTGKVATKGNKRWRTYESA